MKIGLTIPSDTVSERTLNASVEAATEVAQAQLETGRIPPLQQAIDEGVRWAPEANPPGQESFDIPQTVIKRGTGDCDDLAPWWAAELRYSGVDPDAQAEVYQSGPKRFHVVVRRGDGTADDPSRWAGMGGKKVDGTRAPLRRPMGTSALVVGFAPRSRGGTRARLDVVSEGVCGGVALERIGYDPLDALNRAVRSAGILALWGAPDEVLARLAACAAAIREPSASGMSYEDYVGAVTATIDPSQASNIALSILDPFGLRNMIAPAAGAFLNQYAQGPQGAGKKKQVITVQPSTVGRGSSRGKSHGKSRGGSSHGRDGGRDSSRSPSQDDSQQSFDNQSTNATFDPSTGNWYDGSTGLLIDPATGVPFVYEGKYSTYPTNPAPYQGAIPGQPYGGGGAMPGDPYQGGNAYSPYQSGPYSPQGYGVPYGYQAQQYSSAYPNGY